MFNNCLLEDIIYLKKWQKNQLASKKSTDAEDINQQFQALLSKAQLRYQQRAEQIPEHIEFADNLPICSDKDLLIDSIKNNQVVIVCGETGCGKTTQLPKLCLAAGLGRNGKIAHTQPRRIAARAVANRLAKELNSQVGAAIGVKTRFYEKGNRDALIKVMTDGILLAEAQSSPKLYSYECIIIDEAHERSLNIDILLGYLVKLLQIRRELKLIITSATIDVEKFSRHFSQAPVFTIPGRLFPVEILYRPWENCADVATQAKQELFPLTKLSAADSKQVAIEEKLSTEQSNRLDTEQSAQFNLSHSKVYQAEDLNEALYLAVNELMTKERGDILIFLPGEREIREAAETLRGGKWHGVEILPLMSRLPAHEQDKIFQVLDQQQRIILATNVAETSLTIPRIRYVIDSGLARIKRYSYRNKIEQLLIENISQAAAKQRAGRCGRVMGGVCIRLYSEQDLLARAQFNDPEISRLSLAAVILRMKTLHLGEVDNFPFIDQPSSRAVSDAYHELFELGAIDKQHNLTANGKILAKIPIDPHLARILLAGKHYGCLAEILIIVAALTVQDPRERPSDKLQAVDQAWQIFQVENSEFLFWLKLWHYFNNELLLLSRRKFEQSCHKLFLAPQRMREWRDLYLQLKTQLEELAWPSSSEYRTEFDQASYGQIHKAILSGLLGNIGLKSEESNFYLGARGIKFNIHPASPLARKATKYIVASELVDTSKLYARGVAKIEPEWIEEVAAHLLNRQYSDQHWEKKAMQVVAYERISLYGITIVGKRKMHYGPLNPSLALEFFIRQGLVAGEIDEKFAQKWAFYRHNRQLIAEIEHLEHKQRRLDVLVDDLLIADFYADKIPTNEQIINATSFDTWRSSAEKLNPRLLYLEKNELMRHEAAGVTSEAFPHLIQIAEHNYQLSYLFDPGHPRDGVTLTLPISLLNQINEFRCEWLTPGLINEKIIQLIKSLVQKIRVRLVPIPQFVNEFLAATPESKRNSALITVLIDYILANKTINERGWTISASDFRPEMLSAHFFMNFSLIDQDQRVLEVSRNLPLLRQKWQHLLKEQFQDLQQKADKNPYASTKNLKHWGFGNLTSSVIIGEINGAPLIGYTGMTVDDDGNGVSVQIYDSESEAKKYHQQGLLQLFSWSLATQITSCKKAIPNHLAMQYMAQTNENIQTFSRKLLDNCLERICLSEPLPTNNDEFQQRCSAAKSRLSLICQEYLRLLQSILDNWQSVSKKINAFKSQTHAFASIQQQLKNLFATNFLQLTPYDALQNYPRYLKAIDSRLDKLKADPQRDRKWQNELEQALILYAKAEKQASPSQLNQLRWMIEELRIGLFAQEIKTLSPISLKRIIKFYESI